jgi:hypothetical protein
MVNTFDVFVISMQSNIEQQIFSPVVAHLFSTKKKKKMFK